MKKAVTDPRNIAFALIIVILAALPFCISMFRLTLMGKFTAFAILALGLDLIWGYTGILSLGHGVFFGLGAYCMGMYMKLAASGGALPDFMGWSGLSELPFFWKAFRSPVFSMLLIVLVPLTLAFIIGAVTFRNRIRGVYFSIISQALALVFVTLFVGMQKYTGGTNGITGFTTLLGMSLASPMTKVILYYVTVAFLVLTYAFSKWLVSRKTGRILIAIRDGENRAYFSGYNSSHYKLFIYCVSAVLAAVAGALFVPFSGIISPNEMSIAFSVEMIVWVAVGGRGTLIGAVIGALLVNLGKTYVSESFPQVWSYFIGILFIVCVLFMKDGLVGLVMDANQKLQSRFSPSDKTDVSANTNKKITLYVKKGV